MGLVSKAPFGHGCSEWQEQTKKAWLVQYIPRVQGPPPIQVNPQTPTEFKGSKPEPQAVSECANSMNYLSRIIIFLSQEARYPSHDTNFKYYPTVSVRQRPKKGTTASYHGVFCSDGNISGIRLKL